MLAWSSDRIIQPHAYDVLYVTSFCQGDIIGQGQRQEEAYQFTFLVWCQRHVSQWVIHTCRTGFCVEADVRIAAEQFGAIISELLISSVPFSRPVPGGEATISSTVTLSQMPVQ